MMYHKMVSTIFLANYEVMDIVHYQSSDDSGAPTHDVLLAKLVTFDKMEEN